MESTSSLSTFASCPKLYEFKYEKMLDTPGYSSPLTVGSLFHALIEGHIKNINAFDREILSLKDRIDNEHHSKIDQDAAFVSMFFSEWKNRWEGDGGFSNDKFEWIESEKEWAFNSDEKHHVLAGKGDGLVRHKEWGTIFYYEFKTASDRDRDSYIDRLQIDSQVSNNILALRNRGIDVQGVLYDVAWKPSLIRKTGRKTMPDETVEEFHARIIEKIRENRETQFQREIIYRNDATLDWHKQDLEATFDAIDFARERGRFFRNTKSCNLYGSRCAFFSACLEGKAELESLYTRRARKLPELSKEIQNDNTVNG